MINSEITRRDLIKLFGAAAGAAAVTGALATYPRLAEAGQQQEKVTRILPVLQAIVDGRQPVVWMQAAGCTGCSVSLLNTAHPEIADVLTKVISLNTHQTIMAATGEMAMSVFRDAASGRSKDFILIVEGAIPTAEGGRYGTFGENSTGPQTILQWVRELADRAKAVVALGTCASYGGIPAAKPNPIGARSVADVLGRAVLNIPGCPPHPDWIVGTLVHVLLFGLPELDAQGRPKMFYGNTIHSNCPRYWSFEQQRYARTLSDDGCLVFLGCKGPIAHADCPDRHWNNGVNWCIGAKAPCVGCVQPEFPDDLSPLYAKLPDAALWKKTEGK